MESGISTIQWTGFDRFGDFCFAVKDACGKLVTGEQFGERVQCRKESLARYQNFESAFRGSWVGEAQTLEARKVSKECFILYHAVFGAHQADLYKGMRRYSVLCHMANWLMTDNVNDSSWQTDELTQGALTYARDIYADFQKQRPIALYVLPLVVLSLMLAREADLAFFLADFAFLDQNAAFSWVCPWMLRAFEFQQAQISGRIEAIESDTESDYELPDPEMLTDPGDTDDELEPVDPLGG